MSWTIVDVQSGQVSTANSLQLPAFASNPVANDLIVVGYSNWNSTTRPLLTPSDTGGNTYSLVGSQLATSAAANLAVYTGPVVTGGASFRVTGNSTANTAELSVEAWLLRETAGTPIYNGDFKSNIQATTANPNTGTTTPAPGTGSLFLAFMSNLNTPAVTDPSGWNALTNGFNSTMATAADLSNNTPHQDLFGAWKLSDVAVNAQWTEASDTWAALALSWKPAVATIVIPHRPIVIAVAVPRASFF